MGWAAVEGNGEGHQPVQSILPAMAAVQLWGGCTQWLRHWRSHCGRDGTGYEGADHCFSVVQLFSC
jgi:hypothetical protein